MDILFTDKNEQIAKKANLADDVDILHSEKDGAIVVVAQHDGVHICWYCFEQFEDGYNNPKRGVEVKGGEFGTRIMLHAKCVGKKTAEKHMNAFQAVVHNLRNRRLITRVTKPFIGL